MEIPSSSTGQHKQISIVLPFITLLSLLLFTNPLKLPLIVLLMPFILMLIGLWAALFYISMKVVSVNIMSTKKRLVFTFSVAMLPTLLLILKSINQLSPRDGLLLVIFTSILLMYIGRTNLNGATDS